MTNEDVMRELVESQRLEIARLKAARDAAIVAQRNASGVLGATREEIAQLENKNWQLQVEIERLKADNASLRNFHLERLKDRGWLRSADGSETVRERRPEDD